MKIVVASQNPVKVESVKRAFESMFPEEVFEIAGTPAVSGVRDQPCSDKETLEGAYNRVAHVVKMTDADFWVGLEGGIEDKGTEMEAFAWVVVKAKDNKIGKGRTGVYILPPRVAELIRQGKELGEADDIVFKRTNSKQENGSVGILTADSIDRTKYYTAAAILALIPFKNKELY
ncbi:MAG: inositol monophosphatase [Candidatus Ryanbacteria bacterium CG10_big_fil_rev_8_21_14_0_10_43_42]|uniref:Probable inosine/xanthosine triphosphatase n=1 Tax=Candidatus Ryanbacteria bacterium CG10_big_fil_rev_8_21_14_0_10_43_42 TaxID=1974864 RepID=A0A2M8KWU8_9BACT|nr:MAG: inositol monophosphatase [Candidatus Ryanbacteria bacterium CG10_big_fil_rev_8_21_14_0_10_43_42]